MSDTGAPLHLQYLEPSQAEPEVIINANADKVNSFAGGHSSDASDTGGGSVTVSDGVNVIDNVTEIIFSRASSVSSPSAGVAHVLNDEGGGGSGGGSDSGGSLTVTDGVHSAVDVTTIEFFDAVVSGADHTSLLLHMDGSNGSTVFTDSSSHAISVTDNDGASITTSNKMFGTGAMNCTGGATLTAPVTSGGPLDFGTGDFTLECFFYVDGSHTYNCIFGIGTYGTPPASRIDATVGNPITCYDSFGSLTSGGSVTANTWHHAAIVRAAGEITAYLDGVGGSPYSFPGSLSAITSITIGGAYPGQEVNGFMDEVRIQKGNAQYTANFTPPSAPFTLGTPGVVGVTVRGNPVAVAIASLPASPYDGQRACVTDALSPTWGSAVASGGARHVPVYYDGANAAWYVG